MPSLHSTFRRENSAADRFTLASASSELRQPRKCTSLPVPTTAAAKKSSNCDLSSLVSSASSPPCPAANRIFPEKHCAIQSL